MTDAFRGLYRTVDGAYVTNGMMAFHVPEADYRAFGYEPVFESLPWKENYNAAKETSADSDLEDHHRHRVALSLLVIPE
jgi:hypothetical protein